MKKMISNFFKGHNLATKAGSRLKIAKLFGMGSLVFAGLFTPAHSSAQIVGCPGDCAGNQVAFVHGADDNSGSGEGLSAWVSNGDGTFSQQEISFSGFDRANQGTETFGNQNTAMTFYGDANNDGYVDVIHATENHNNSIHVWLNNGDNTFQTTRISTINMQGVNSKTFAGIDDDEQGWIEDADGDGNLDYIFSGDDHQIAVWLGNGNGTFSTTRTVTALTGSSSYKTSGISSTEAHFLKDLNGDGAADLFSVHQIGNNSNIIVWLSNADGTYSTTPSFSGTIPASGTGDSSGISHDESSYLADADADGDLDYVFADGVNHPPTIAVFLNDGLGNFANTAIITNNFVQPLGNGKFAAGIESDERSFMADVNGDGAADYVYTVDSNVSSGEGIYVYLNNGIGTFATNPVATILNNFQTGNDQTETSFLGCGVFFSPTQEICNNGIDDDGDGQIDCADGDCAGIGPCPDCDAGSVAPKFN